jgi:hypothetical protein
MMFVKENMVHRLYIPFWLDFFSTLLLSQRKLMLQNGIRNVHSENSTWNETVNIWDAGVNDRDECDMFPTNFPATHTKW